MGDTENNSQPSKKRAAKVQLSRDNPGLDDNEDTFEQEGTFKKAPEEVLATRRIVKVRRQQTPASAPSSAPNPFAAIRLVPPPSSSPPNPFAAINLVPPSTEKIDESKSENKVDNEEPKGEEESTAEVAKTDENKIHDSEEAQSNADKDETNDVSKPDEEEAGEGSDSADVTKKAAEADDEEKEPADVAEKAAEADDKEEKEPADVAEKAAEADDKEEKEPADVAEKAAEADDKEEKEPADVAKKDGEAAPFSSFQQLSSGLNAFSGVAGTGFSSGSFSFGSVTKEGSSSTTGSLFGFGVSNNGNSSFFGTTEASIVGKSDVSKIPTMQEVTVETGEEDEAAVFTADSILFEFIDGGWKERGKGELKVNVSTTGTKKARLVMRARGNFRLILNASIFPDMKLTNMDKKGVTFACVNSASEGKDGLSTIALKFKDVSIVEDFKAAVIQNKGQASAAVALKTPENSPKADDADEQ